MRTVRPVTKASATDELLTRADAAAYLGGLKPNTLAVWATSQRYRLPFIKIGNKVLYRRSVLDAFLESNTVGAETEGTER